VRYPQAGNNLWTITHPPRVELVLSASASRCPSIHQGEWPTMEGTLGVWNVEPFAGIHGKPSCREVLRKRGTWPRVSRKRARRVGT
jgi:hypothetical protein